jgi:hypothetical protein
MNVWRSAFNVGVHRSSFTVHRSTFGVQWAVAFSVHRSPQDFQEAKRDALPTRTEHPNDDER